MENPQAVAVRMGVNFQCLSFEYATSGKKPALNRGRVKFTQSHPYLAGTDGLGWKMLKWG